MTTISDTVLSVVSRIPMRAGDGDGGGPGYGGGSGYGPGSRSFLGSGAGAVSGAILIVVVLIILVVLTLKITRVHRTNASAGTGSTAPDLASAYEQMRTADPAFDIEQFDAGIRRIFHTVQTGWTSRNPGLSRAVMADGIWQAHRAKIAGYVERGAHNRLDLLRIKDTFLQDIRLTPTDQTIAVRFVVESNDYVVTDDGTQIGGTKMLSPWTEDWIFVRTTDGGQDWVLHRIDQLASLEAGWSGQGPSARELSLGSTGLR